jgi:hypothetical protein
MVSREGVFLGKQDDEAVLYTWPQLSISSSHQEKVLQAPHHDVSSFAVNGSRLAVN